MSHPENLGEECDRSNANRPQVWVDSNIPHTVGKDKRGLLHQGSIFLFTILGRVDPTGARPVRSFQEN